MEKLWCTFFSSLGGENAGYDRKDGSWGIWALPFVNYPHSKWNKRQVLFIFAFWFQLLLYLVSFCLFLLASLRFLNRGYQGGSCLSQNCLALPMLLCRFGELTAITNIGRTGRRGRSETKRRMEVSQLFLSETVAPLHYTNWSFVYGGKCT